MLSDFYLGISLYSYADAALTNGLPVSTRRCRQTCCPQVAGDATRRAANMAFLARAAYIRAYRPKNRNSASEIKQVVGVCNFITGTGRPATRPTLRRPSGLEGARHRTHQPAEGVVVSTGAKRPQVPRSALAADDLVVRLPERIPIRPEADCGEEQAAMVDGRKTFESRAQAKFRSQLPGEIITSR